MTVDLAALEGIEKRVLWLATRMIHEANHVRSNPDHTKVGGHQASSASVVSILTALYFGGWLNAGDRVSIKPHSSPVFHAIQYLLGNLERRYLTTLREFGGLQAYPSRTKDPDPVDFSTGSVGLGAAAPLFAALADRYAASHFHADQAQPIAPFHRPGRRRRAGRRQRLGSHQRRDYPRHAPGQRAVDRRPEPSEPRPRHPRDQGPGDGGHVPGHRLAGAGGQVRPPFAGGVRRARAARRLRKRIDEMPNEEYQDLVRLTGAASPRAGRVRCARSRSRVSCRSVSKTSPTTTCRRCWAILAATTCSSCSTAFQAADAASDRPTVLFAYTMKGWGLPFAGDPLNHSALLSPEQIEALRLAAVRPADDDWACLETDSAEGRLCSRDRGQAVSARRTTAGRRRLPVRASDVPDSLPSRVPPGISTQEVFGNTLVELARLGGPLAERIVTASPDVTISTNLGGWVNRTGVWAENPWQAPATAVPRLLRWEPGPGGQHIELGISEMNLFMLLGQLGLSHELNGELLLPVGTVYDPFVCRGLDALIYSVYSGSKFVFAGTPAGVTLSPGGWRAPERDHRLDRPGAAQPAAVRAVLRARDGVVSAAKACASASTATTG